MKCEACRGLGVVASAGPVRDCESCCGTGICPVPEVGATQAAIDWLRAELYLFAPAQRMMHARMPMLGNEPRIADAVSRVGVF